MPPAPRRILRTGLAGWLLASTLALTAKPPPPKAESSEGTFVFSFLPKSFSKNPLVDQTVITEMTEEGKKLPPPTRGNPAYYLAQAGGYRTAGHDPTAEPAPSAAELEATMKRALAVNSYLPAAPGHPPVLLVIYHWGQHNNLDPGSSEIDGTGFGDSGHALLLSRAQLVGGSKFAAELKTALEREDSQNDALSRMDRSLTEKLPDYGPLRQFTERDGKTRQLYAESLAPCYYVIVSAYDYAAASRGLHKLLWRSKLTVEAPGVTMTDTLPSLIANGARYLGRDMPEAATMTKPIEREGHTKLGPMQVEEYLEKPATPAERKP
ncbi:MAG: hypothetical protein JWQ62_1908 [Lacunisphaera sp.]|nr:hypothetical protein [Lacunisphaera sp.]